MIRFLKLFLLGFFLIYSFQALAIAPNESLSEILKNTKSIQADFTESLVNNQGKNLQQSRGKMYLQTPGLFRWETLKPSAQLIIANGNRLWVYDKDLEQVTIRAVTREAGQTPALLLSDAHPDLDKSFSVTNDSSATLQKFILVPKDKSSMYAKIEMDFTGNVIKTIIMQDHLGHATIIHFANVKTNGNIPTSLFKFSAPKNVDIIDETKKRQ